MDASLVSKWKSGARKINSSSIYFDQIVDFILEESEKSEHLILNDVLSQIYPLENIKKQNNPEVFIRRLLDSKDLSYCQKIFVNFDAKECEQVVDFVSVIRKRGALYSYLPAPAFISTSEELLEEILLDNKVDDKTILECLNINKKMKSMIKTQLHGLEDVSERIVEIFQIEQMERRLREDEFVSCSLSILTSRKIKVSKDQFARALKHLTDQLKLNDNMRVVLFSEKDNIALPTMPDMNFWCKQNTWIVQMGKKGLRISDEVSTVNAASISFERCIRKVPPKRKEKISVINYLNELSRNL